MTEVEYVARVAWCAGFLDGEGTIAATRKPHTTTYAVGMSLAQRTLEPLYFFQTVFGGKMYGGNKGTYQLGLRKAEMRVALDAMIPYLVVKKSQAIAVRELILLLDTKTTNWAEANYVQADALVVKIKQDKRPWLTRL